MRVLRVDPAAPDAAAIERAAETLGRGGLVAFPTETVYGLGANALDPDAVCRIFEAKGRPSYNPIIVHVHDTAGARALAREWPAAAERLAAAFWPGPLTLVVPKRGVVPDLVTAGLPAVGLRVPSHPVALALLRAVALPVAAPSANRSTEISPTTAEHVRKGLGERVDVILDGGPTTVGIESTVVGLTGERPALLRPGIISAEEIERLVGPLMPRGIRGASEREPALGEAPRLSPGMLDRHYAPRARLLLVHSAEDAAGCLRSWDEERGPSGALVRTLPDLPVDHLIRLPVDPEGYAHGLYAALHALDDLGCTRVLVEAPPPGPAWDGVRDRLTRAASR